MRRYLLGFLLLASTASTADGQFMEAARRKAFKVAFCGAAAIPGKSLGDRLTNKLKADAGKMQMKPEDVEKYRRHMQIGTAVVLCKTGAALAGTIYAKLSERDLKAREREIEAAVQESEPVTRDYVLPESNQPGRITTEEEYRDGEKTCKKVVDRLADVENGEPAVAVYCKKKDEPYQLDY